MDSLGYRTLHGSVPEQRRGSMDQHVKWIGRPLYHHHLQKSGGTSINFAFLSFLFDDSFVDSTADDDSFLVPDRSSALVVRDGGESLMKTWMTLGPDRSSAARPIPACLSPSQQHTGDTITGNGLKAFGHRRCQGREERFFFGFSHAFTPRHCLPADAYCFTCLRNPFRRVVSFFSRSWPPVFTGFFPNPVSRASPHSSKSDR